MPVPVVPSGDRRPFEPGLATLLVAMPDLGMVTHATAFLPIRLSERSTCFAWPVRFGSNDEPIVKPDHGFLIQRRAQIGNQPGNYDMARDPPQPASTNRVSDSHLRFVKGNPPGSFHESIRKSTGV